jgi:hypothetical protein
MNSKTNPRARLLAISGATLALVVAGGAVASAHPGEPGGRGDGPGRGGQQFERGMGRPAQGMPGLRGFMGDTAGTVVRRETILQTDTGVITERVDNGTATSATDTAIEYTLATGETASATVDADTQIIAFSEDTVQRGLRSRTRMLPAEIAITDVTAGAQIGVWAESQDDGSFLAQRIVVQPDVAQAAAADDTAAGAEATASAEASSAPVTEG